MGFDFGSGDHSKVAAETSVGETMTSKAGASDSTVIVLAMHGVPPRDFPPAELAELMALSARLGHGPAAAPPALAQRHAELDARIHAWPLFTGSQRLASRLRRETRGPMVVGFNEFCAPSLDAALDEAAREHAEVDIPAAIERARKRHPAAQFIYAWPFEPNTVVRLLAEQVRRFGPGPSG